jgi:hypothetical protein
MKLHRIYALTARVTHSPSAHLQIDLDMSAHQRRQALLELLLSMPEQDGYNLLASTFPEWFKPALALTDALRWALEQIEDDLDPDHQAALAEAWATFNRATGEAA